TIKKVVSNDENEDEEEKKDEEGKVEVVDEEKKKTIKEVSPSAARASMNSLVPDRAMVPKVFTKSANMNGLY
nr:hypothetical protein [Tanacetum cinerariifolium]